MPLHKHFGSLSRVQRSACRPAIELTRQRTCSIAYRRSKRILFYHHHRRHSWRQQYANPFRREAGKISDGASKRCCHRAFVPSRRGVVSIVDCPTPLIRRALLLQQQVLLDCSRRRLFSFSGNTIPKRVGAGTRKRILITSSLKEDSAQKSTG